MNIQEGSRTELRGDPLGTNNGILPVRIQLANIDRLAGGSVFKLPRKFRIYLSVKDVNNISNVYCSNLATERER